MVGRQAIFGARFSPRRGNGEPDAGERRRTRRSWQVEPLEGRLLLSVYVVDRPGDMGAGSGLVGDLRYVVQQADLAKGASTILFAPTLTGRQITLSQGPLTIDKPSGTLSILGPGPASLAISGNRLGQVIDVTAGSNVTIRGLSITGGTWSQGGAGLSNEGQLTLMGCTIAGNTAYGGGGGAIGNGPTGTMSIFECTISGNVANVSDGGGIVNAGTMTIDQSTINGNASRGGNGGGIANTGVLAIGDSTISGNRATIHDGGGIANSGALILADDTISDNTANFQGGGIANLAAYGGSIDMNNTIVADNASVIDGRTADILDDGDAAGNALAGSHDLVGTGDLGSLTATVVGVDPQLGPLQNNGGATWTQAISSASPAAHAGDPSLVPAALVSDQRGFPYARMVSHQVDIGAFEIQPLKLASRPRPSPLRSVPLTTQVIIGLTIVPDSPADGTGHPAPGSGVATASA